MNNSKTLFNSYLSLSGFPEARILHMVQGDKTPLEFMLQDKNKEPINLPETKGVAQIIDSQSEVLRALPEVTIENGTATFVIDETLPAGDYEIYIKIGNFYFPSTSDSFILKIVEAYDVVNQEEADLMTIDVVVDALREDVISALSPQVEQQVADMIENEPERFRGEKGEAFTYEDFTPEQIDGLRGEDATPLKPSELDSAELELIRGHKGDTGDSAYEEAVKQGFEGSEKQWLASMKGDKGDSGDVSFNDLNEEQRSSLFIPPKVYTRDEYNQLESYDPNTLYFIEGE